MFELVQVLALEVDAFDHEWLPQGLDDVVHSVGVVDSSQVAELEFFFSLERHKEGHGDLVRWVRNLIEPYG